MNISSANGWHGLTCEWTSEPYCRSLSVLSDTYVPCQGCQHGKGCSKHERQRRPLHLQIESHQSSNLAASWTHGTNRKSTYKKCQPSTAKHKCIRSRNAMCQRLPTHTSCPYLLNQGSIHSVMSPPEMAASLTPQSTKHQQSFAPVIAGQHQQAQATFCQGENQRSKACKGME